MFALKNIIVYLMMVYLFVGTSGVIVHEHYCKKEGASFSLFLPVKHDCHFYRMEVACHEKVCCATPSTNSDLVSFQKEPCCDEFVNYLHVDQDWNNHDAEVTLDFYRASFAALAISSQVPASFEKYLIVVRPPPIPRNIRLAFLQSYLI
jgi:hypothetical protein